MNNKIYHYLQIEGAGTSGSHEEKTRISRFSGCAPLRWGNGFVDSRWRIQRNLVGPERRVTVTVV